MASNKPTKSDPEAGVEARADADGGRKARAEEDKGSLGETLRTIVYAVLIAVGLRTLAYEPFNIPSASMEPTLLIGDFLFVSKFSYGYSKYSLPFSPDLFEGRILGSEPERGDVVVFRKPTNVEIDFIKRVVGLPGDRIQVVGGILHINGQAVKRELVAEHEAASFGGRKITVYEYLETLPNGVTHKIFEQSDREFRDNTQVYTVPAGHYFMMGDNRDRSTDSRVLSEVGYVPYENLIGRAEILFFSIDEDGRWWQFWNWPTSVRWGRLGQLIQ